MTLKKKIREIICEYCDRHECSHIFCNKKNQNLPRPYPLYIPTLYTYCRFYKENYYNKKTLTKKD